MNMVGHIWRENAVIFTEKGMFMSDYFPGGGKINEFPFLELTFLCLFCSWSICPWWPLKVQWCRNTSDPLIKRTTPIHSLRVNEPLATFLQGYLIKLHSTKACNWKPNFNTFLSNFMNLSLWSTKPDHDEYQPIEDYWLVSRHRSPVYISYIQNKASQFIF